VPAGHPLRAIRSLVGKALSAMAGDLSALYSGLGRPSIAPGKLLRAKLLQAFCSIRSERQLMERLEFDLLVRWFVGLGIDDASGTTRRSRSTATGCSPATSPRGSCRRPA